MTSPAARGKGRAKYRRLCASLSNYSVPPFRCERRHRPTPGFIGHRAAAKFHGSLSLWRIFECAEQPVSEHAALHWSCSRGEPLPSVPSSRRRSRRAVRRSEAMVATTTSHALPDSRHACQRGFSQSRWIAMASNVDRGRWGQFARREDQTRSNSELLTTA